MKTVKMAGMTGGKGNEPRKTPGPQQPKDTAKGKTPGKQAPKAK